MWGWQGWCGNHGDNGDNMGWRQRRPQPWGPHGDLLGAMGMTWGWQGWHGDDVGMMGMMWGPWGQCGDHKDNEITKNAITFEQIEIIEFRLKIWDPWTLLHTRRLHLMCRWRVSYPKWHFYAKSALVTLQKNFSGFALDPIFRLSPERIFDLLTHLWPIEIAAEMKTKCKIWLKYQFSHRTVNYRKKFNAPLDALMCPLQIINDSEPLSLTLHSVNACFIHHASNVENYLICHKSKTNRPKQKKIVILDNIFLHPSANFEVKIQNTHHYRSRLTFQHLEKHHLMAQQTTPPGDILKNPK